jgi:hypothetical protein
MTKENKIHTGMKLYKIEFDPEWPVPSGLIILAKSKLGALKIAKETLYHTEPKSVTLIEMDEPKVIFFESGNY